MMSIGPGFTARPPTSDGVEPQFEDCMTFAEWWAEFHANACCPDPITAARRLCGCRGSAEVPSGISRLLTGDPA